MFKIKKYIYISNLYNKRNSDGCKAIVTIMTISITLLIVFFALSSGIQKLLLASYGENYNNVIIKVEPLIEDENSDGYIKSDLTIDFLDNVKEYDGVDNMVIEYTIPISNYKVIYKDLHKDNYSYITGVDTRYSTFPKAQILDFKNNNESNSYMVSGRDFRQGDTNSIIINEHAAKVLGVTDMDLLVNDYIYIETNDLKTIKLKVIGIFDEELSIYSSDINEYFYKEDCYDSFVSPKSFIFSSDVINTICDGDLCNSIDDEPVSKLYISTKNVKYTYDIIDKIEKNSDYYVFSELLVISDLKIIIDSVKYFTLFISSILFIVGLFNIVNNVMLETINKVRFFGVLQSTGYSKFSIIFIQLFEKSILLFKAIVYSLLISLFILLFIDSFLRDTYVKIVPNVKWIFFGNFVDYAAIIAICTITVIFSVFLSVYVNIRKKSIVNMLNGE